MNRCDDRIKELISLYADNELTKDEIKSVDQHVANCSECMEELQLYKEIHDELDLDSIEAPKGFHKDLLAKLDLLPSKARPSLYKRYNKYINVAAMLVFVIFLSIVGLTQGNKWGQTSDESIMIQADMTTETTMAKEVAEGEEAIASEAKMYISEEETTEEVEEETMKMTIEEHDEALADDTIESKEVSQESALLLEESSENHVSAVPEATSIMESQTDFDESSTPKDIKESTLGQESHETSQEKDPMKEAKPSIFIYIFLTLLSFLVGGSCFYFIRKRILKN